MTSIIYKIATQQDWEAALSSGEFIGSPDDLRDGFIHFSTAAQLQATLDKHYANQRDLVLASIDTNLLTTELVWEPSRGGQLFPHLYHPMNMSAVVASRPLHAETHGGFSLPELA